MRLVKKLAMSAICFLLFFMTIEVFVRFLKLSDRFDADFKFYIRKVDNDLEADFNREDALLMWSLKPGYNDGEIKINSQGLRDKEYPIKKREGFFRILCLGDSNTFGLNMDITKVYHALLEDRLNNDLRNQTVRFEVINAGVTGYTSLQGLNFYKYRGREYYPDLVIFYFGICDPIKRFYLSDKDIMSDNIPLCVKLFINNVLLKFDSYRLFRKAIMSMRGEKLNLKSVLKHRVSPDQFKENIIYMNRICKLNNSKLLIISAPLCKEIKHERSEDIIKYRKIMEEVAFEQEIPVIEVNELTEKSELPNGNLFEDEVHPNAIGHKLLMDHLYKYIIDNFNK